MSSILGKLGVRARTQAVLKASEGTWLGIKFLELITRLFGYRQ